MTATARWQELGDGVFRRRYEFLDQNVGVVLGTDHVLLVDSRSHPGHVQELLADLKLLTPLPVGWVFNTHYHWDHAFGNQVFAGLPIWGHVNCRTGMLERGLAPLGEVIAEHPAEAEQLRSVVVTPPTEVFEDHASIDLGERRVELSFLGRGHTEGDAVLEVGDVTFAGDLVEEGAPPGFGDSFPVAWFDTVGRLAAQARPTVVPGHGDTVDVEHLVVMRFDLGWVTARAREMVAAGQGPDEADLGGSPYPDHISREALARAHSELMAPV